MRIYFFKDHNIFCATIKKDDVKVKKRREKLKTLKKGWIDNIKETSSQKAYLSGGF